jgi:hypothetical protein
VEQPPDGYDSIAHTAFQSVLYVSSPCLDQTISTMCMPQLDYASFATPAVDSFKKLVPLKMKDWPFYANSTVCNPNVSTYVSKSGRPYS